jgi:hypothetical protein
MKHPALRCAVTALLVSGACSTYAADSYWYTGLGVGLSRVQFYPADFSGTAFSESKDEFDAGFKGFIGYQFNQNWAAEMSFASLGKFHYRYDNGSVTQDGVYQVSGWGYSVVPTIPFTRNLSVFGRLGAFFSQARMTFYNNGFVPGAVSSGQQFSDASFLTGFGAQYFFDGETGMRIEYENFGRVGNECNPNVTPPVACTGRANAKMLSVSAVFRF